MQPTTMKIYIILVTADQGTPTIAKVTNHPDHASLLKTTYEQEDGIIATVVEQNLEIYLKSAKFNSDQL